MLSQLACKRLRIENRDHHADLCTFDREDDLDDCLLGRVADLDDCLLGRVQEYLGPRSTSPLIITPSEVRNEQQIKRLLSPISA